MKKLIILFFIIAAPIAADAQLRFGYFSYSATLRAMPEYAVMEADMADLKAKYDAEMKRAEDEFNAKYETFLEEQRDLVPSILHKRQVELQEMMDKNVEFKHEAARLLEDARKDACAPLRQKLNDTVRKIGQERGYILVVNTDGDACPYIDVSAGEDITPRIKELLNIQ